MAEPAGALALPDDGEVSAPIGQPSHTIYGGAHLFRPDLCAKLNATALSWFERYALPGAPWPASVLGPLGRRLRGGAVEDIRIDFEDGYGPRSDEEEDGHARQVGRDLLQGHRQGCLPSRVGVRPKPLTRRWGGRAQRTLELVASELEGFERPLRVTLPKTTHTSQVEFLKELLDRLQSRHQLSFEVELMVESPAALPQLRQWAAAEPRLRGVHFGPADFLASCRAFGDLHHPLCTAAKSRMLFELIDLKVPGGPGGLELADGPTTVLPVPVHRGTSLSESQKEDNWLTVERAWQVHAEDVRRSRELGFCQSWLLHPGQMVSLQAQLIQELAGSWRQQARRLRNFLDQAAQATRVGEQFDDRGTARLLRLQLEQALAAGLTDPGELEELLGRPWEKVSF